MDAVKKGVQVFGLLLTLSVVTGCTTYLDATRVREAATTPTAGAPYYLTFTQYSISITRRVVVCTADTVQVAVLTSITRAEAPDPQRIYVIDLDALQSALKSTDVTVQYHANGALKSVNAIADDRTGPVIVGAATMVAKVATSAVSGGVVGMQATRDGQLVTMVEDKDQTVGCSAKTVEALEILKRNKPMIEATAAAVSRSAADLANLTTQAAAMGEAWGDEERKRWAAKQEELYGRQSVLFELQKQSADAVAHLSVVSEPISWPANGEEFESATAFGDLRVEEVKDKDGNVRWGNFDKATRTAINEQTKVWLRLYPMSPIARTAPCPITTTTECAGEPDAQGLKYRVPAAGALLICSTKACKPDDAINQDVGPVNQLGPVFVLPLRSAVFTKKTVKASFDEQGRPIELGVESGAAAEAAVTAAAGVTEQALKVRESTVSTRLERLKAETELLTAEKALDDAKKALAPPPPPPAEVKPSDMEMALAALNADTTFREADLANLRARAALDEARRVAVGQ